jgi:hypothetical protein
MEREENCKSLLKKRAFPGVKRPGRGADHPPPSSAEVEMSRAIPLLPVWVFVACYRVSFTFTWDVT